MQKSNALVSKAIQISLESAQTTDIRRFGHNTLIYNKFVFAKSLSAKIMSKRENVYYRDVRLVQSKKGWYISYYFAIPVNLLDIVPMEMCDSEWFYKGQLRQWARFRYTGLLNRIGTPEYRERMLKEVKDLLEKDEYSPFDTLMKYLEEMQAEEKRQTKKKERIYTLSYCTEEFLKGYKNPGSKGQYETMVKFLKEYFTGKPELPTDPWHQSVKYITTEDLMAFMQEYKKLRGWKPNTFNDKLEKLRRIFEYQKEQRWITENPATYVLKEDGTAVEKHKYYQDDFAPVVQKAMEAVEQWGPYLRRFCEMIFYTCTRPDQETRRLKIENIKWEHKTLIVPHEIAKGGFGGPVYMGDDMISFLKSMDLHKYPGHYYIFGKDGPPGPEPTDEGFYSDIFREEVRIPQGWDEAYTIYGWKHRRCVKMWLANAGLAAIQQACRHKLPSTTEQYLRALGCDVGVIKHSAEAKF